MVRVTRLNDLHDDVLASAEIVITERWTHGDAEAAFARRYRLYEWRGPRWGVAWVSYDYHDHIHELPWPVKVVGVDWRTYRLLVARLDGLCRLTAWWHDMRVKARNMLALIKARLIVTAMVWGLGYVPQNEIPSWRHLFRRPGR